MKQKKRGLQFRPIILTKRQEMQFDGYAAKIHVVFLLISGKNKLKKFTSEPCLNYNGREETMFYLRL